MSALTLAGIPVYLSEAIVEQFRFPRTKKRRIRNKWAKRSENFRPARKAFKHVASGALYMHPWLFRKLARQLHQDGDALLAVTTPEATR